MKTVELGLGLERERELLDWIGREGLEVSDLFGLDGLEELNAFGDDFLEIGFVFGVIGSHGGREKAGADERRERRRRER